MISGDAMVISRRTYHQIFLRDIEQEADSSDRSSNPSGVESSVLDRISTSVWLIFVFVFPQKVQHGVKSIPHRLVVTLTEVVERLV